MPARPAMAVRWMMALVEPPIAISTRSAFSTDFSRDDLAGRMGLPISATPRGRWLPPPRRRAGMHGGNRGRAGQGTCPASRRCRPCVLAVPITAQVPAVAARRPSTVSISSASISPARILRPEAAAIGAGAEPLAAMPAGRHRAGDQLHRGNIGRHRAHQLRRHGLVAAADQHHRVHRLGADHLLGVHRHQVAEHHAGGIEEHLAQRDGRKDPRQPPPPARRATPPRPARACRDGNC